MVGLWYLLSLGRVMVSSVSLYGYGLFCLLVGLWSVLSHGRVMVSSVLW